MRWLFVRLYRAHNGDLEKLFSFALQSLSSAKFSLLFKLNKDKKIKGLKNFRVAVFRTNTSVLFTSEGLAIWLSH